MGSFVAEAGTGGGGGGGGERAQSVEVVEGKADYVYKGNGNPDLPHENGDGDLPSFSIKRLRRLPLRVACESPRGDRSWPEEALVADGNGVERQALLGPDAAHSCGGGLPEQEQKQEQGFSDLSIRKDDAMECIAPNAIAEVEPKLENGKHTSEETELRNPGGGEEADISSPEEEKQIGNGVGQEKQAGNGVGEEKQTGNEISDEANKEHPVAATEHALDSTIGESGNTLSQFHANPEVEHTSVDDQLRENASPGASDTRSLSAGLNSVSENVKDVSSVEEDPNQGSLTDDKGKASEEMNLELASPGIVQILAPVMGSRFESPGETTDDEETDSPRSSEGFAYPDSDAMALPYSGQIMYPGSRFSSAQTVNGPNLLQYSGSMSLRSDSSTTSNRSFAFPILAPPEWNGSPVRMAKAHPRRKNRFEGCCFFRLSRIRNKY